MFQSVNADLIVHLHPKFANSLREGINDYLSTMLTKYVPELKSVVLAYDNFKAYSKAAVIKSESPFLHFKINVDFTVFKPVKDTVLVGLVTKVSPDHVACSVYGFFTASIYANEFPKNSLTWNKENNHWQAQSSSGLVSLEKDSIIKFRVAGWTISDSMISIKGSLVGTNENKLGILNSEGIAPCPSYIVEPVIDAMDIDYVENGIVDPFADDEIEEMNEKQNVVILAEDSQAHSASPAQKDKVKKSALKNSKNTVAESDHVILAEDSQEVPATQDIKVKAKKEKTPKKVVDTVKEAKDDEANDDSEVKETKSDKPKETKKKKKVQGKVEDGDKDLEIPEKKIKKTKNLKKKEVEVTKEAESSSTKPEKAGKKSKSKAKNEKDGDKKVENRETEPNSIPDTVFPAPETPKDSKPAKKRKTPEDSGDSSKKSKKKGKKTAA